MAIALPVVTKLEFKIYVPEEFETNTFSMETLFDVIINLEFAIYVPEEFETNTFATEPVDNIIEFMEEFDANTIPTSGLMTMSPALVLPVDNVKGSEPFAVSIFDTEIVLIV
jgi:hypothetical protein